MKATTTKELIELLEDISFSEDMSIRIDGDNLYLYDCDGIYRDSIEIPNAYFN